MSSFDRGAVRYALTSELTSWDDALIKKNVVSREQCLIAKGFTTEQVVDILAKERAEQAEAAAAEAVEPAASPYAGKSAGELDEIEEEEDDDAMLQRYREERLHQMREAAARARFGTVLDIVKADWLREVNDASKSCWVVVHLYQDAVELCGVVDRALQSLAAQFRDLKIVRIRSTAAIENWPDAKLPTLFAYREGELKHQFVGIDTLGGEQLTSADLEWRLSRLEVLETELEADPGASRGRGVRGSSRRQVRGEDLDTDLY